MILCLQCLVAFLHWLVASDIIYYATIHRMTVTGAFDLGWSPLPWLWLALGFWCLHSLYRGWRKETAFCLIPFLFYVFLGEAAVSISLASFSIMIIHREGIRGEALKWLLILLTVFYSISLVHWTLLYPLGISSLEYLADLDVKLFSLGTYVTPLLAFMLLSIRFSKPYLEEYLPDPPSKLEVPFKGHRYLLILSVVLAMYSAIYPYLSGFNPGGEFVGVDAEAYVRTLNLVSEDIANIEIIFGGYKPFFFLVLRAFQVLTLSSAENAVKFFPILLLPFLVFSTYCLTWMVFKDPAMSAWSAFFTATGYKITVGLYSYFLSDIFGLILIQFSLTLLFLSIEKESKHILIVSSLLGALCLFTHPWTFNQYVAGIALLFAILIYRKYRDINSVSDIYYYFIYLIILFIVEIVKHLLLKGPSNANIIIGTISHFAELSKFWYDSIFSFRLLYGGYLSNLILLCLGLIGILYLDEKKHEQYYFILFMILTLTVFIFTDETIKSRLFYNLPIEIVSSAGLYIIPKNIKDKKIFYTFIICYSLSYLFRSLANLV
jgi:hypothetical protein